MEWALDNTFKDTKIEFEDLDGLSWPGKPALPPANPDSPLLEPLFGLGKPSTPAIIYETGWAGVPSSPACCKCDFDRSACQLHRRKLSRSRRTSEINLNFPRVEVSDPFAFVPIPSEREQELDLQRAQIGASIVHPSSVKQVDDQSRPFRLLELPSDEDLSPIGPPPGLPPPDPEFQPRQGVPFPTRV